MRELPISLIDARQNNKDMFQGDSRLYAGTVEANLSCEVSVIHRWIHIPPCSINIPLYKYSVWNSHPIWLLLLSLFFASAVLKSIQRWSSNTFPDELLVSATCINDFYSGISHNICLFGPFACRMRANGNWLFESSIQSVSISFWHRTDGGIG